MDIVNSKNLSTSFFVIRFNTWTLSGNCRILAFPAPFFFDHKHLVNRTIRIEDNVDFDICQLLCYHEDNCVSINYDLNTRSCELNNATHRGHDNEFVYKENSLYHGSDVSSSFFVFVFFSSAFFRFLLRRLFFFVFFYVGFGFVFFYVVFFFFFFFFFDLRLFFLPPFLLFLSSFLSLLISYIAEIIHV